MQESSLLWTARALLLGLLAFAIYYPYRLWTSFVPFLFSGDTSWQTHWMVDDTALVPLYWRVAELLLWTPTILATEAMIVAAIWLTVLLMRGTYFERRTVRALMVVGISAATAGVFALVAIAFDAWMITAWNEVQPRRPIAPVYESGEIGVTLTGLGLMLLAYVLDNAVDKRRENAEIV